MPARHLRSLLALVAASHMFFSTQQSSPTTGSGAAGSVLAQGVVERSESVQGEGS